MSQICIRNIARGAIAGNSMNHDQFESSFVKNKLKNDIRFNGYLKVTLLGHVHVKSQ